MNIGQITKAYQYHKNTPCPLTDKLVKAGYQQISGGYIARAKAHGITVDYTQALPSQWWHLMSYCELRSSSHPFTRSVVCGEMIFWMAEVSNAVSKELLAELVDRIIADRQEIAGKWKYDRVKWNREIQNVCFSGIEEYVAQ